MRFRASLSILSAALILAASAAAAAEATGRLSGRISTVAGVPGTAGFHDGPVNEATFNRPTWLDVVAGNDCGGGRDGDIYVIDRVNQSIRKISGGFVSTYIVKREVNSRATTPFAFDFGGPFGGGIVMEPVEGGCGCLQWDRGMFIASTGSQQIVLVSLVGLLGNRDTEQLIGQVGTAGPNDSPAQFNGPTGLTRSWDYSRFPNLSQRFLYVADTGNHTIRRFGFGYSPEACPVVYIVSTLAGVAGSPGWQDGVGASARFNTPRGLATAGDGSLYVTDSGNHTIRRITPQGMVTTVAGEAGVPGSNDGPALQAHLNTPSGIDVNARGEVFIADTGNHVIRMLTRDGMLVTIAGTPGVAGFADGDAEQAMFSGPVGLRIAPDGTILIADTSNNAIRQFTAEPRKHRAAHH
jgi:hypothetical protein